MEALMKLAYVSCFVSYMAITVQVFVYGQWRAGLLFGAALVLLSIPFVEAASKTREE